MIEERELRAISQMLEATYEMARDAKMIASKGEEPKAGAGVRQYNAVVKRLQETDTVPEGFFAPLTEDDSIEALGVCCTQLSSYLKGLIEHPEEQRKTRFTGVTVPQIKIIKEESKIGNLDELIRNAMPKWVREHVEKEETEASMSEMESKMAELGAQMQELAEKMQQKELSGDEMRKLADQMRELGKQQSELAKQHATMRADHNEDESPE